MAVVLSILFLMSGLQGIYSISTVRKVAVKTGSSVSIPCHYEPKYLNHVKYLCRGYEWRSCTYEIKTNQRNSGKYSIHDDKTQRVFTVTIKDVTHQADFYWCNVEINIGGDEGVRFQLQVTKDTPGLHVTNQEIKGFIGETTSIHCFYQHWDRNILNIGWCKIGRNCVMGTSGWIDGSKVTIDSGVLNVFTVTMSDLSFKNAGWYYCAIGDLQMPVQLTVTQRPSTTSLYSSVGPTQQTSTSVDASSGSTDKPSTTVETPQSRSTVDLLSLIASLILLTIIVLVAVLIWFLFKKRNQTETQPSQSSTQAEDTLYRSVRKNKRPSEKECIKSDDSVTYSDVVFMRGMGAPRVVKDDPDVTYSTVSKYN